MAFESDQVDRALANGELSLCFQPQVDARTRKVVAVEALLRGGDCRSLPAAPAQLIRRAERSGEICSLGAFALSQGLRQAARWREEGIRDLTIAVNVSPVELKRPDFVSSVMGVLRAHQLAPQILELEITEEQSPTEVERITGTVRRLFEAGVTFAIDDFGIGYGSFGYLSRLPVGTVKLDRSLTANVLRESRAATLAGGMIDLSHRLGAHVVAEGIETERQAEAFSNLRCDRLQGFYFGRPMTASQCTALLREHAA